MILEGSLVLYKLRPARVTRLGEKLDIEIEGGETQKVRPKDVALLHPGPIKTLAEALRPQQGEVATAWEMLAGSATTLPDLAELAYGAFTPATAWAAWQIVAEGLYFRGAPDAITACTAEEVARTKAARAADFAEKQAWAVFVGHVRTGHTEPQDVRYLREIEAVAFGRTAHSRVLRDLDREETPEAAHALLLDLGYWTPTVNPYPSRLEVATTQPDLPLPPLPDEPRRDLTHLAAFAIDDATTDMPDDALSFDAGRLWVHVADTAAIVSPDSPLDIEARGRGASLYLPEGAVHMLPPAATPLLALGLSEVSPALSFGLDVTPDGRVIAAEIIPSWVRVTRLTYEEATVRIAEAPLADLYRLANAYLARREEAGAISIHLPEVDIRVVDGEVTLQPVASQPEPRAGGKRDDHDRRGRGGVRAGTGHPDAVLDAGAAGRAGVREQETGSRGRGVGQPIGNVRAAQDVQAQPVSRRAGAAQRAGAGGVHPGDQPDAPLSRPGGAPAGARLFPRRAAADRGRDPGARRRDRSGRRSRAPSRAPVEPTLDVGLSAAT